MEWFDGSKWRKGPVLVLVNVPRNEHTNGFIAAVLSEVKTKRA